MSIHQPTASLARIEPASFSLLARRTHRSFDLPPALFVATVGCYLAYLAIMAATFMTPELIIPFAIFTITVIAAFAVPAMWARVEGPKIGHMPGWDDLMRDGIDTCSGHLSGGGAAVQVLIMPAILLGWGLIIAVIRAAM